MTISINEFARRICMANHTLNHANPADSRVPCSTHMLIANSAWGLTQASGMKTLAVINAVVDEAGLIAAAERDPHTQAVMKLVGKGDPHTLTAEDWDRYLAAAERAPVGNLDIIKTYPGESIAGTPEWSALHGGTPADAVEGGA